MKKMNGWVLNLKDETVLNENMNDAVELLTTSCDHEIGFCVIGERSFVVFDLEKENTVEEQEARTKKVIQNVLGSMPDFEVYPTANLNGVDNGALVIMQDAWEVIPMKDIPADDGLMIGLYGRTRLMEALEKGEILGTLLPEECAC